MQISFAVKEEMMGGSEELFWELGLRMVHGTSSTVQ